MTDADLEDVPTEMLVGYLAVGASATMKALSRIQRDNQRANYEEGSNE